MNLDELQIGLAFCTEPQFVTHVCLRRLDEGGFAHAARPPQQRIVGGQAAGETAGILDQLLGGAIDPLQQRERLAVDLRDG